MQIYINMGCPTLNPSRVQQLFWQLSVCYSFINIPQIKYPSHCVSAFFPSTQRVTLGTDLHKALLWTWGRKSRRTRSTVRTRVQNWTGGTHTVHRNTRPGRCTSLNLHAPCHTHNLTWKYVCMPRRKLSVTCSSHLQLLICSWPSVHSHFGPTKPGSHTQAPHSSAPRPRLQKVLFASGVWWQSHTHWDSSSISRASWKPTGRKENRRGPARQPFNSIVTLKDTCVRKDHFCFDWFEKLCAIQIIFTGHISQHIAQIFW